MYDQFSLFSDKFSLIRLTPDFNFVRPTSLLDFIHLWSRLNLMIYEVTFNHEASCIALTELNFPESTFFLF